MAILKPKNNKTQKTEVKEKNKQHLFSDSWLDSVIKRPRVTEKATFSASKNVYVFDVSLNADKREVARAVSHVYSVTPVKIRIVRVPSKQVFIRGKWGVKKGGRKAYVYLKEGDKIEIV